MADEATSSSTIKRIPKACGSCRQSKVRCDGSKPCERCQKLLKECIYAERPRDPTEDRFGRLEQEVFDLRAQINFLQTQRPDLVHNDGLPTHITTQQMMVSQSPAACAVDGSWSASPAAALTSATVTSPLSSTTEQNTRKRKRTLLQLRQDAPSDFISSGLLRVDTARLCFNT